MHFAGYHFCSASATKAFSAMRLYVDFGLSQHVKQWFAWLVREGQMVLHSDDALLRVRSRRIHLRLLPHQFDLQGSLKFHFPEAQLVHYPS